MTAYRFRANRFFTIIQLLLFGAQTETTDVSDANAAVPLRTCTQTSTDNNEKKRKKKPSET